MLLNNKKGFSLLELVMVCLMIGILTSIAVPKYRRAVDRARVGEAVTLVHSIYDSCERYAWENGPWTLDNGLSSRTCATAVAKGGATFRNLDITIKGTYSDNGKTLFTNNFDYELTGFAGIPIIATYNKANNPYNGAKIYLDSNMHLQCDASGTELGEGQKACEVWGASTWNQDGASGYWK